MISARPRVALVCAAGLGAASLPAAAGFAADGQADCLQEALVTASDELTVGELRKQCAAAVPLEVAEPDSEGVLAVGPSGGPSVAEARVAEEQSADDKDYLLTAHQPNYLLATYSGSVNQLPFAPEFDEGARPLNNEEIKFQISIKAPVWRNPLGWQGNLYAAYTSVSWWQLGNTDISNPFRETNYEPELFIRSSEAHKLPGLKFTGWDLGFNHQSNGRSGELSRSWNRIMGRTLIDLNEVALAVRAWYRVADSSNNDDNPDIERYMGYGDVRALWVPSRNSYTLMYRPAAEGGALEFTWSRQISRSWRIYAQYWNGYGESLIDYDFRIKRIGIGFALNDFLER